MLSTDFACRSRHQVARALAGDDYGLKSALRWVVFLTVVWPADAFGESPPTAEQPWRALHVISNTTDERLRTTFAAASATGRDGESTA